MAERFSVAARARSFRHAFIGLRVLLIEEHNARIHLLVTAAVVAAGVWFDVAVWQWCVLVLSIGAVFCAEALNAGLEALADAVSPDHHPLVGKAKDVAAAGVLIMAVAAAVVGVLIFLPLLLR